MRPEEAPSGRKGRQALAAVEALEDLDVLVHDGPGLCPGEPRREERPMLMGVPEREGRGRTWGRGPSATQIHHRRLVFAL